MQYSLLNSSQKHPGKNMRGMGGTSAERNMIIVSPLHPTAKIDDTFLQTQREITLTSLLMTQASTSSMNNEGINGCNSRPDSVMSNSKQFSLSGKIPQKQASRVIMIGSGQQSPHDSMLRVKTKTSYETSSAAGGSGIKHVSLELLKLNGPLTEVSDQKLKSLNCSVSKSPVLQQVDSNKPPTSGLTRNQDFSQHSHVRKLSINQSKQSPFSTFNSITKGKAAAHILIESNSYQTNRNAYPRQASSSVKTASKNNSGTRKSNMENRFLTKTFNKSAKVVQDSFSKTVNFVPFTRQVNQVNDFNDSDD